MYKRQGEKRPLRSFSLQPQSGLLGAILDVGGIAEFAAPLGQHPPDGLDQVAFADVVRPADANDGRIRKLDVQAGVCLLYTSRCV